MMRPRTLWNLARTVTPRRLANFVRITAAQLVSAALHRPVVWGMPWTLTIEPTNRCNLACPECPSGNGSLVRPLGSMSLERFTQLVDEVSPSVFYLQLFFQGEPFINKSLAEMVAHAHRRRMYTAISTNAHFLRADTSRALLDAGLDRLIVSVDGTSEATYQTYRVGGTYAAVLRGLDALAAERRVHARGKRLELVVQFLVTRQNEHEIDAVRKLAARYDASLALKTMQVYSVESAAAFLPQDEKYRRYVVRDGDLVMKGRMANRCARLWDRSVITWDGVVVPCCFDKNAEHAVGSVDDGAFEEVWRGETLQGFRGRVLSDRRGVPMCTNCTEGLRVYR